MEVAYSSLLARDLPSEVGFPNRLLALDGKPRPRIVTLVIDFPLSLATKCRNSPIPLVASLGGDHTIVLPILRALNKVYGPVSVIHFDAHLDTWATYPGQTSEQSRVTHGTFFYLAQEEGLMTNTSVHAGIRCKLGVCNMPFQFPLASHLTPSSCRVWKISKMTRQ